VPSLSSQVRLHLLTKRPDRVDFLFYCKDVLPVDLEVLVDHLVTMPGQRGQRKHDVTEILVKKGKKTLSVPQLWSSCNGCFRFHATPFRVPSPQRSGRWPGHIGTAVLCADSKGAEQQGKAQLASLFQSGKGIDERLHLMGHGNHWGSAGEIRAHGYEKSQKR
jgi:hypothetical protein